MPMKRGTHHGDMTMVNAEEIYGGNIYGGNAEVSKSSGNLQNHSAKHNAICSHAYKSLGSTWTPGASTTPINIIVFNCIKKNPFNFFLANDVSGKKSAASSKDILNAGKDS